MQYFDSHALAQMWGEDTGIEIKFIQKLENYHNEKKDVQEKSKRVIFCACGVSHQFLDNICAHACFARLKLKLASVQGGAEAEERPEFQGSQKPRRAQPHVQQVEVKLPSFDFICVSSHLSSQGNCSALITWG